MPCIVYHSRSHLHGFPGLDRGRFTGFVSVVDDGDDAFGHRKRQEEGTFVAHDGATCPAVMTPRSQNLLQFEFVF